MKQTTANLLTIESTANTAYAGDTAGDSIVVTGSGSASKGETAQQYGLPGLICNPPKGTIGLQIKKGSLSIVVGSMNYSIPLPTNQGETLLCSYNANGAIIGKLYLNNVGEFIFNDGVTLTADDTGVTKISNSNGSWGMDDQGVHTFNDGADYAVRYTKLEEKVNELTDKLDNHVHPGVIVSVSGGSGSPAVGVTGDSGASVTDFTTDISTSKVTEVQLP